MTYSNNFKKYTGVYLCLSVCAGHALQANFVGLGPRTSCEAETMRGPYYYSLYKLPLDNTLGNTLVRDMEQLCHVCVRQQCSQKGRGSVG